MKAALNIFEAVLMIYIGETDACYNKRLINERSVRKYTIFDIFCMFKTKTFHIKFPFLLEKYFFGKL